MHRTGRCRRLAAILMFSAMVSPAAAAAPDLLDPAPSVGPATAGASIADYALDTELVVRNWVLCVSEAVAEELVQAREESIERAQSAYAQLNQARSCGQVSELRVILRERLYASSRESGHDARVFGALVDFAGSWASAYVVYGGLPEQ